MRAALAVGAAVCIGLAGCTWLRPDVLRSDLAGYATWAVCVSTVIAASLQLSRILFSGSDWMLRGVASVSLFQALSGAVVTWAGSFGLLTLGTQLIVVAFIATAVALLHDEPRCLTSMDPQQEAYTPGPIGLAGLAVLALAWAQVSRNLIQYLPTDTDNMWYHFPMIGEWVRTQSISPADAIPPLARGYPGFREAAMTFLTIPVGTEHLAIPGLWELPAFALVCVRFAKELQVPGPLAWAAASYAMTVPQVAQAGTGNDLCLALQLVTAVLFLNRLSGRPSLVDSVLAGVALGALAATKYSGLIYSGMLVAAFGLNYLLIRWRARLSVLSWSLARDWLVVSVVAVILAAPWYVRNLVVFGNPMYPARLTVGAIDLFPGPYDRAYFASSTLKWDILPLIENSRYFAEAFGWLIPFLGFGAALVGLGAFTRPKFLVRYWPLLVLPAGLFVAFLHQPFNRPSLGYDYNMRYLIAWFAISLMVMLLVLRSAGPAVVTLGAAGFVVGSVGNVAMWTEWWRVYAVTAIGAAAIPWMMARLSVPDLSLSPPARDRVMVVVTVLVLFILAGWVSTVRGRNQYSDDYGYRDSPSSKGWGAVARFVHAELSGQRIAVIGDDRIFPMYGDRFGNSVLRIPYQGSTDEVLTASRAGRATAIVCLNPISNRTGLREYQFTPSIGADLLRAHPDQVRKLFEAEGAYVLEIR